MTINTKKHDITRSRTMAHSSNRELTRSKSIPSSKLDLARSRSNPSKTPSKPEITVSRSRTMGHAYRQKQRHSAPAYPAQGKHKLSLSLMSDDLDESDEYVFLCRYYCLCRGGGEIGVRMSCLLIVFTGAIGGGGNRIMHVLPSHYVYCTGAIERKFPLSLKCFVRIMVHTSYLCSSQLRTSSGGEGSRGSPYRASFSHSRGGAGELDVRLAACCATSDVPCLL